MNEIRHLTTDEVSAQLRVKAQTLRGWRLRGYGPPYTKLGSRVFYPEHGLHDWLAKQTRHATAT